MQDLHASSNEAAKLYAAKSELASLTSAIELHAQTHGRPPLETGTASLPDLPDTRRDGSPSGLAGRRDPWINAYVYRLDRTVPNGFIVYSTGANGKDEHGGGDDVVAAAKDYCASYPHSCANDTFGWAKPIFVGLLLYVAFRLTRRLRGRRTDTR